MSTTSRVAARLATTSLAALVALTMTAGPVLAADVITVDSSGTTIAADPGTRASASIPKGIVVTDPGEQPVVLTAKGMPTLRKPRPGNAPAVFRDLKAGTTYTVRVGGKVLTYVTAVDKPSAASHLVVSTASSPESVNLRWQHSATPSTGGTKVAYDVSATPATGKAITKTVTRVRDAVLTGLDPHALYTFSVTPRNSAGKGRPTTAAMTRSLAEIMGTNSTEPVKAPTSPTPVAEPKAPVVPVVTPPPAPAPAPAPPAPAPAPKPSTKTIYVCPAGYTEISGLCQRTMAYTYDVLAYTYHAESIYGYGQTGWAYSAGYCTGGGRSGNWPNGDPFCQTPVYGNDAVIGTQQVKDATPAGYTDTGSNWSKKNATPAGWLDDGTQWVKTVAMEAQVVPA